MLANIRSLVKKRDELANLVKAYNSSLVFITETWLCDKIPNEAIQLPGMTVIRKDRTACKGGGVAIYISNNIPAKTHSEFSQSAFECLWVILRPRWLPRSISRLAVAVVYLPPSMTSEDIEQFYDYFYNCYDTSISESSYTSFIVVGDFNPTGNGFCSKAITRHSKLKQIIEDPTRGSNILDLVFTDISALFETPRNMAPIGTSDHATVFVASKVHAPKKKVTRKVNVRPLKESSLQAFDDYLKQIDWSPVFFENHVDNKVNIFLELTCNMIDTFFPTKSVKVHDEDKPFLTGKIKKLIDKRNKAFKSGNFTLFKTLRNTIVSKIRLAKRKFYENKISPTYSQNPKVWWRNINDIVGKRKNAIQLLDPDTELPLNNKETADHINAFFSSITNNFHEVSDEWLAYGELDLLPSITEESVAKKLRNLNVGKTAGPHDPYMKLIKMFPTAFAIPLTNIYNKSFLSRLFPNIWKFYTVCGVPKVSPCSTADQLRPISLTSIFSKLQESYVMEWIYDDIKGKIRDEQFGGLPGSSAVLALVSLAHKWFSAMEEKEKVVRIIFLDFRKAFDLIDHNRLLQNCEKIGVRPAVLAWLASYLQGRSQVTKFENVLSDPVTIKGGVPQGSKIGPLAFVIHINDLPSVVHSSENNNNDDSTSMFMDDTTLFEIIGVSEHISRSEIGNSQRNLDSVVQFTKDNKMQLHPNKCKEMQIDFRKNKTVIPPTKIDNRSLAMVRSYKLLGLWFDDDLKWRTNTEYIIKKGAKRLYLLKILKSYKAPKEALKRFYIAVVRSAVEYGAQVWSGNLTKEQVKDIERIQKRAMKIICPELDYHQALAELNIKSLADRRDTLCIQLIKDMSNPEHRLHHLLPSKVSQINHRDTRSNGDKYYNFPCKTERYKHSPLFYAIEKYNSSF